MKKLIVVWDNGDKEKVLVQDDYELLPHNTSWRERYLYFTNDEEKKIRVLWFHKMREVYFDS